jgi:DNA-binding IclR family transcriptional regulator
LTDHREISQDVERLIARCVSSVGELDLLLLLHAHREQPVSVTDVCAALRCPPRWAERHLETMARNGLATGTDSGAYRYSVEDPQLASTVDELVAAARARRGEVVRRIFASRQSPP